jgi:glycine/D-amino acid oxidase-like deaminating enzyme
MTADVAVVGAGSFGVWTAWHLRQAGRRVLLLDGYGSGNSRASSGGESRIIRAGYGPREIYTRFSVRSLQLWRELADRMDPSLFHPCGALWLAPEGDPFTLESLATLEKCSVRFDRLERSDLAKRFPLFRLAEGAWALFEPEAGALMARRAVQTLARGLLVEQRFVRWEGGRATLDGGERLDAGSYVFACGPWLPKIFPDLLARRIAPSRQEVFFFGPPSGGQYGPDRVPCWIDVAAKFYGMGDLEHRGFKVANDLHGPPADPDTEERVASAEGLAAAREYLAQRIPSLASAPLLEARVCQYENTANGDYLIDRHPGYPNVWIAGGGSGHGFKHGPAVGEYLARRLAGSAAEEDRFTLASKPEFEGAGGRSSFYRQ